LIGGSDSCQQVVYGFAGGISTYEKGITGSFALVTTEVVLPPSGDTDCVELFERDGRSLEQRLAEGIFGLRG